MINSHTNKIKTIEKKKVGFDSLIWKYIKKITSNFLNQYYIYLFKNNLKYIHF